MKNKKSMVNLLEANDNSVENPLVSVVIPIYKVEEYLRECIDSVISQTYKNLEIILVDDGSPDNCPAICDEYAEKDNRIKVIHKENGGLSDARNAGIKIATGEYISFIDSDDYISNNFIQSLLYSLIVSDSDISICKYIKFTNELNVSICNKFSISCESPVDSLYKLYSQNEYIVYTVVWNKMYKKSLFNDIWFPVGKIHEDEFTTYKLLSSAKKVAYIDAGLYYYRQRESSIMGNETEKNLFLKIQALEERNDFYPIKSNKKLLALNHYKILFYKEKLLKKNILNKHDFIGEIKTVRKYFFSLPLIKKIAFIKKEIKFWNT